MSVTDNVRSQAGAEVTSQVNGIASLPTEAGTDTEDEEEECNGHVLAGVSTLGVDEGEDDKDEDAAGDKLGPEHGLAGHELGRVRAEDAGGGGVADDGAHGAALEVVDGVVVVAIHDEGASHGAQQLAHEVDGELAPRVAAVEAVDEGHDGVKVATRRLGDIEAQHDTKTIRLLSASRNIRGTILGENTHPQPHEILWYSPFSLALSVTWATEPLPNRIMTMVPPNSEKKSLPYPRMRDHHSSFSVSWMGVRGPAVADVVSSCDMEPACSTFSAGWTVVLTGIGDESTESWEWEMDMSSAVRNVGNRDSREEEGRQQRRRWL